jgi:hypothetical protein
MEWTGSCCIAVVRPKCRSSLIPATHSQHDYYCFKKLTFSLTSSVIIFQQWRQEIAICFDDEIHLLLHVGKLLKQLLFRLRTQLMEINRNTKAT